jgi:hypothetical protein
VSQRRTLVSGWLVASFMAVATFGSTAIGPPAGAGVPVTGAFLAGEAGDYISGGRSMWFPAVQLVRQEGTTRVTFVVTAPDHGFSIDLAAPPGEPLRPGEWEAERSSFRAPGRAGVDVSGEHRGCSSLRGRLLVDEATFDPAGTLRSFSARFQQRCVAEGGPVLFGSLSWRSSVPYRARRLEVQRSLPGTPRLATITNQAPAPLDVHAVRLVGRGADSYHVALDTCSGVQLPAGGSCIVVVVGQPSAEAAYLAVTDDFAAGFRVRLDRDGVVSP